MELMTQTTPGLKSRLKERTPLRKSLLKEEMKENCQDKENARRTAALEFLDELDLRTKNMICPEEEAPIDPACLLLDLYDGEQLPPRVAQALAQLRVRSRQKSTKMTPGKAGKLPGEAA